MMEVAIPWSMLGEGCAPSSSREMRMNIQVRDRRSDALLFETIPEALDKASWTWPEFALLPGGTGAISTTEIAETHIAVSGNEVSVETDAEVSCLEVYTVSGSLIVSAPGSRVSLSSPGIYIAHAILSTGDMVCRKISVR